MVVGFSRSACSYIAVTGFLSPGAFLQLYDMTSSDRRVVAPIGVFTRVTLTKFMVAFRCIHGKRIKLPNTQTVNGFDLY